MSESIQTVEMPSTSFQTRTEILKGRALRGPTEITIDRARLITEGYKMAAADPVILRRSKAIAYALREISVCIFDAELIVGDQTCSHQVAFNFPDFGHYGGDSLPKEFEAELAEIAAYWRERPRLRAQGALFGHTVPGFAKLLRIGFNGIKAEAQARLNGHDPTDAEQVAKRPFWEAMAVICDGAGEFAKRYADLARSMVWRGSPDPAADSTEGLPATQINSPRSEDLLAIAETCEQVPAGPARTFHQAVQSLWFGHLLIQFEDPPNAQSIGRLDQILYPYYRRDLEEGTITPEQAKELLTCFALKIWKSYDVQNTMLGGLTPDGRDATNDLTYIYLDILEALDIHLQVSVRCHRNTPEKLFRRICEINKKRRGVPQIFNDDVIIPGLVEKDIPLEEARDYAIIGCVEITIPGRMDPRVVHYWCNMAKCLEYALNDGVCMITGEQRGLNTGDPSAFKSFEDVMDAYSKQVEHDVEKAVAAMHQSEIVQREVFPMPILSTLTDDCTEKGIDITAGGARYNSTGVCGYAMADVADSLAVIKKLVFEEDKLSLTEMIEAMKTDFEGNESLRQMFLNSAPKYGNDDEYVDSIAAEICEHFCRCLENYHNVRGGRFHPHLFSFVSAVSGGKETAATAAGRRALEPLANSLAPQQGNDRKGSTAVIKSATRIDQSLGVAGNSFMLDLHPTAIAGENGTEKLASLLRTYLDLGGMHVEFNIVDEKMLRHAQSDPQKYRNLSVRVAGYSAYFVNLDRDMQEHIIRKTKNRE